jgi:hypothetical protein
MRPDIRVSSPECSQIVWRVDIKQQLWQFQLAYSKAGLFGRTPMFQKTPWTEMQRNSRCGPASEQICAAVS